MTDSIHNAELDGDARLARQQSRTEQALEKRLQARSVRRSSHCAGPLGFLEEERATELEREAVALLVPEAQPTLALGEVVPTDLLEVPSGLVDTLKRPDQVAIDASLVRSQLLTGKPHAADLLATALDAANSVQASNSIEKMGAYLLAAAFESAMRCRQRELETSNSVDQTRWANAATRATTAYFEGMAALQKVRQGASQTMTVKHVHVAPGGQALIGPVAMQPKRRARGRGRSGKNGR